jgi:hypothetical protein
VRSPTFALHLIHTTLLQAQCWALCYNLPVFLCAASISGHGMQGNCDCSHTHSLMTDTPLVCCAADSARSCDSIRGWMAASVSQLQGLQAQHDDCHQAACTHFESAVTQLVSSLESGQDPGSCCLLQGLLCKARLAQAESCLYMVSCSLLLWGYVRVALGLLHPSPCCSLPCVLTRVSACSTDSCTG